MLAYAASRPVVVDRRPHPNAMLLIVGAHVAALALVMSAKMDLPIRPKAPRTTIFWVAPPKDPEPNQPTQATSRQQTASLTRTDPTVSTPPFTKTADAGPKIDPGTALGGLGNLTIPDTPKFNLPPVKYGPELLTPASELKPPYPASKLDNGEEAVLRLKLTIDENGRVIAVEPVGRADAVFLDAARRYVMGHWRYKPASEDGRGIMSTAIVTLHFELNG